MIRWGVLGAASVARRRVIPAIQTSSNGRVTAIASRDPARAHAFAAELDLPVVHADYQSLLADPEIDAVYIPLPNSEHRQWTIAAAEAGKHILCEKPLALTAGEAEEMVAAARQAGVLLAEAFMYRFHPRVEKLLSLVEEGAIGELRLIRSTFTVGPPAPGNIRLSRALGGGALMDIGSYAVNFARLVTGQEPEAVSALATYGRESGVDETFAGILRFRDGVIDAFDVSMLTPGNSTFEVLGANGKIVAPAGFRPESDQPTELHLFRGWDQREVIPIEPTNHYRLMVEDFAGAIQERRPVRFAPEDAVANMRVLDALRAAAEPGANIEKLA